MSIEVEFIPGPFTSDMARTAADSALQHHPAIQKGASYALEQMDGRWIAAIVHTAGPFPPGGGAPDPAGPPGGGPADMDEEAPGPKSEGPDDADPSAGPDGPPGDDSGDGDGPPKEKGEKGGEKGEIHQVMEMLHQVMEALGLPVGMDQSMMPGSESPMPPPAGPPHGPGGPGGPAEQHVIHERVTKPGETPPGGTPVGAPAFASVRKDHPWAHLAGKLASFEVTDQIGDTPINEINSELTSLASELPGYKVARLREDRDDHGKRVAVAVISAH